MTPADRKDELLRPYLDFAHNRIAQLEASLASAESNVVYWRGQHEALAREYKALTQQRDASLALNTKLVEALRKVRKLIGKGGGTTYTAADEEMYNITADALDAAEKGVG